MQQLLTKLSIRRKIKLEDASDLFECELIFYFLDNSNIALRLSALQRQKIATCQEIQDLIPQNPIQAFNEVQEMFGAIYENINIAMFYLEINKAVAKDTKEKMSQKIFPLPVEIVDYALTNFIPLSLQRTFSQKYSKHYLRQIIALTLILFVDIIIK